jgi:hypothetical protein
MVVERNEFGEIVGDSIYNSCAPLYIKPERYAIGPPIIAGNKIYARCNICGNLVRMNGFWGGWHIC